MGGRKTLLHLCAASLAQCRKPLIGHGGTDVNNCSLYLPSPRSLSCVPGKFPIPSQYHWAPTAQIGFLKFPFPATGWAGLNVEIWKLGIFLMFPTDALKHKLLCGLMKYINIPQNDFGSSKTRNEGWITAAFGRERVEKWLNTPCWFTVSLVPAGACLMKNNYLKLRNCSFGFVYITLRHSARYYVRWQCSKL